MTGLDTVDEAAQGIGVGVIGCGHWGMNYLRVFRELPEVDHLVAVDSRPHRLKEIISRCRGVTVYETVADALQDDLVNAVVICTQQPRTTG